MKSIALSVLVGWLARIMAIATNLIGIPLVLQQLGHTQFGIVLIAMSVGSWVGIGNLGIGRAVANVVARYFHRSQAFIRQIVFYAIATSLAAQGLIFGICVCILLFFANRIDLGPVGISYRGQFIVSTIMTFFTFSLWFFLMVFEGIDAGLHRRFRVAIYHIVGYAFTLVMLFTVFRAAPSIVLGTFLLSSGFVIGNLLHTIDILFRHRELFRINAKYKRKLIQIMMLSTIDFTIISLRGYIIYQSSTSLLGLLVGPEEIVNFGVFMKIMVSIGAAILSVTHPMSDMIAGRMARNDHSGALNVATVTGSGLLLGGAMVAVAFALYGDRLISIWLHTPTVYDPLFRAGSSMLIFATVVSQYITGVAIGYGRTRTVARNHAVEALVSMPVAWLGYLMAGQAGILLAMDAVLILGAVVALRAGLPLGRMKRRLALTPIVD